MGLALGKTGSLECVAPSPNRHNEGEKMELIIIGVAGLVFVAVYKIVSKREKESVLTVEHPWVFDEIKYAKIQRRLDEQLDKMWAMTK